MCVCVCEWEREKGGEPKIANNTSSIISFNVSKENNCLAARDGKFAYCFRREWIERERESVCVCVCGYVSKGERIIRVYMWVWETEFEIELKY